MTIENNEGKNQDAAPAVMTEHLEFPKENEQEIQLKQEDNVIDKYMTSGGDPVSLSRNDKPTSQMSLVMGT